MGRHSIDFNYLRSCYNQDADSILDGIEWDHAKAAQDEDEMKNAMSAVFCPPTKEDEDELVASAIAYADGQPLPRLRSAQRWRFAMRLRFAAALLQPLGKGYIDRKSKFYRQVATVSSNDLTKWILTDGVWFCCSVFNEIVFTKERSVCAPFRPPWKPNLRVALAAGGKNNLENKHL